MSPRDMSPLEIARRRKEAEERKLDLEKEALERARQQKALDSVVERLSKERAAEAVKQHELEAKERAQKEREENALQAEQVDEVLRRMQQRALKKASLTPVKSPLVGPKSSLAGPAFFSIDPAGKDAKRKAEGDSPESPRYYTMTTNRNLPVTCTC